MNRLRRLLLIIVAAGCSASAFAQFDESGIAAGFFDSSREKDINFSEFHLPPLAVLFENAKSSPQIMSLEKARQLALAEVAKERTSPMIYQFQGSEQSYWNIGVNLSVPLEDILDISSAVKRKKIEVEQAAIAKDIAYDELKLQIATLFVKITNNLVTLKTLGETAAAYQGAGALNREEFENGNMSIEDFAWTKQHEGGQVKSYQSLQTEITTDILTLEILTHTPIITNSTTEITLDTAVKKSDKEIAKEQKAVKKRIKKAEEESEKREKALEKAERKAEKAAIKALKRKK